MQFIGLIQHLEDFERGTNDSRSERIGEEVRARALAQEVNNFLAACGETAHGAAEGLAQRASVDIHATIGVEELADTSTCLAYHTCAMAFVHHHERIVLLCQVTNLVHRSDIAVHGEDTVCHDNAEALFLGSLQLALQICHICICIAIALGLAQTHTIDDAGMIQGIRNDSILLGQQGLEDTAIGIEASSIEDGVLRVEETADGSFQFLVNILSSADEAHTGHTIAAAIHHPFGALDKAGIVTQTKIVVGTEVQHFFSGHLNGCCLWTLDEALFLVETCLTNLLQRLLKVFLHFSVHSLVFFKSYI